MSVFATVPSHSARRTVAALRRLYERIADTSADLRLPGTLRIIASPQREEVTIALQFLAALGFKIKRVPASRRGVHRYFVRPDKYCIFFRLPAGNFFGMQGTDKETIARLRRLFEAEWDA